MATLFKFCEVNVPNFAVTFHMPYSCHVELIPLPLVSKSKHVSSSLMTYYMAYKIFMCMTSYIKYICTNFHCTKLLDMRMIMYKVSQRM